MTRIAAIGECMIELSGAGDDLWRTGFAGDTFNTLWTMRGLLSAGDEADYVTAFGDDPFSTRQQEFFREAGIGTASSPVIAGARPGLYAITLTGAERSFTYWRADAAARRLADDPEALGKSLEGRALVYFSGITLAILAPDARAALLNAIQAARENGAWVAFDPNYRPRLWPTAGEAKEATAATLPHVDIVLPTFPDEQALYGDADADETARRFEAAGFREIVVKDGADPALLVERGHRRRIPAVDVAHPLDTTGAGDSFNGAYLAARLLGLEADEAVLRAHKVAAAVVQVRGALAPPDVLRDAFGPVDP